MAVVAAWADDNRGIDSGSAYVFRWNGSAWVEEQKLTDMQRLFYGDRNHALLIVLQAMYGTRRFVDFQQELGIARNILVDRLCRLVDNQVLRKVDVGEHGPRHEYRLTDKGRDLFPVVIALRQWGDKWTAPDGPPVDLVHRTCGHVAEVVPTCSEPVPVPSITRLAGRTWSTAGPTVNVPAATGAWHMKPAPTNNSSET